MPTDFDNNDYVGFPAGGNKKTIKELQNEAVRNFVQRLKEECAYSFIFGQRFITERVIDKLLKEYEKK